MSIGPNMMTSPTSGGPKTAPYCRDKYSELAVVTQGMPRWPTRPISLALHTTGLCKLVRVEVIQKADDLKGSVGWVE